MLLLLHLPRSFWLNRPFIKPFLLKLLLWRLVPVRRLM
ncbi:hypothetical protein B8V81_0524 [Paenibacillus pasadenensis]|uniref:Uncharacterized protein n=1 Tax=Paenibacillus pasadenensis TaxID=217090 RepID=A0A2N5NDJ5_9BACL|nr:hypothetical protein B8V81_0524 [Paenibacillus pasadenensis]